MKNEHKNEYAKIGLKIAYYRKLNGFTQEQLAERIDKSWSFIAQVESVKSNKGISIDTLLDISKALNVEVYKFLKFD